MAVNLDVICRHILHRYLAGWDPLAKLTQGERAVLTTLQGQQAVYDKVIHHDVTLKYPPSTSATKSLLGKLLRDNNMVCRSPCYQMLMTGDTARAI